MRIKVMGYLAATAFIALETFVGGVVDVTRGREAIFAGAPVADVVTSLGYPVYVLTIVGSWKILGAIVLVIPRFPRLKEWAYAGIVFELSGAAVSHAVHGNKGDMIAPLVFMGITLASWALRPPNRTLGAATPLPSNVAPSSLSRNTKPASRWQP